MGNFTTVASGRADADTSAMNNALVLDSSALTCAMVEAVARRSVKVRIAPQAVADMAHGREALERIVRGGAAHYGVNTGFGSLSRTRINDGEIRNLQVNLVRSHAAGVGAPLDTDLVRAMMIVLAASLSRGLSGVRPVVVETLVAMLNAGVVPRVPEVGSVGASGDLAPLAHVALTLIGEGEAAVVPSGGPAMSPKWETSAAVLKRAGIAPVQLEAKEGLALLNGTHLMAGWGALLCMDAARLSDAAVVATAMSIDACRATDAFLDPRVYAARSQPGPAVIAARVAELLQGSEIIVSHRENDARVQDPYCLRCAAIVTGAAVDAIEFVRTAVTRELGAVTDNPLLLDCKDLVSAGNFHGMPVALPLDVLTMAVAHVAGISERRTYFMLAASAPEMDLSPYLSPKPGLHSGLMIAQYTAAACCNEIVGLASPASVVNIPTSAGMEDYNSFGPRAAAKAARSIDLARRVIAIELMCAAQGIDLHRPLRSGHGVEQAHSLVRARVPMLAEDRPLSGDIETLASMIADGAWSSPA